uniref:Putative secreted protein n=1 Tax=Ixodes ricinus TaxID=34613 RepID=A0A6B0USV3_IXORI
MLRSVLACCRVCLASAQFVSSRFNCTYLGGRQSSATVRARKFPRTVVASGVSSTRSGRLLKSSWKPVSKSDSARMRPYMSESSTEVISRWDGLRSMASETARQTRCGRIWLRLCSSRESTTSLVSPCSKYSSKSG